MRRAGRIFLIALVMMAAASPAAAGFDSIARKIERTQHVRRNWIPFISLGRLFVRIAKPDGIHDFKVAIFDDGRIPAGADLLPIVREEIGPGWRQMVRSRSRRNGECSTIWAREDGSRVRMIILSQEEDETVLLEVAIDPDVFADSLRDPATMGHVAVGE